MIAAESDGAAQQARSTLPELSLITLTSGKTSRTFATGLVWFSSPSFSRPQDEARSQAAALHADTGGWVRWATRSQFALARAPAGQAGRRYKGIDLGAAVAVARVAEEYGIDTWIACLPVPGDLWWLLQVVQGELLPSGDLVTADADAARDFVRRSRDEKAWRAVFAPADWFAGAHDPLLNPPEPLIALLASAPVKRGFQVQQIGQGRGAPVATGRRWGEQLRGWGMAAGMLLTLGGVSAWAFWPAPPPRTAAAPAPLAPPPTAEPVAPAEVLPAPEDVKPWELAPRGLPLAEGCIIALDTLPWYLAAGELKSAACETADGRLHLTASYTRQPNIDIRLVTSIAELRGIAIAATDKADIVTATADVDLGLPARGAEIPAALPIAGSVSRDGERKITIVWKQQRTDEMPGEVAALLATGGLVVQRVERTAPRSYRVVGEHYGP